MGSKKQHTAKNSEKPAGRVPAKLSATPWKLTLPGKILAVCICLLPFITFSISSPMTETVREAFFLISGVKYYDFEQLCREIALLVIAVLALAWFIYERISLRPRRALPVTRITIAMLVCLGLYLLLGLLSTLFSDYQMDGWIGNYTLYEGYLALLGYAIVFIAAWYWVDRKEVVRFVQSCLTVLGIVIGILALLENSGICYYNFALIQKIANLNGTVSYTGDAVLTFGNADYLGLYCATLLPVQVSSISLQESTKCILTKILSAVLLATALLLTHVTNAILFGFGATILFLLIWMFHNNLHRALKLSVTGVTIVAIVGGGVGFVCTRSGDTLLEKLEHTVVGADQEQTFQLLEIDIDGTAITLGNKDTALTILAEEGTLSADTLTFYCNDIAVTPQVSDGTILFTESELAHCQIEVQTEQMLIDLGYSTNLTMLWNTDSWQVEGIGGTILDTVPQVCESKTLQSMYTYLNGRVFVWLNTLAQLDDCIFIGHGPATTVYYLEQNDLPALLNIFSKYVLFNKPHNWYLQMIQDTGLLSMLAVVGMLGIFTVYGAKQSFGKKRGWNPWRTGLWFGVLVYALSGIMNDSLIYHAPMFWFLFGIATREMTAGLTEEEQKAA